MPTDLGDGVPRYSRREWGATGDGGSPGPKNRDHVVEHTFAMDSPGAGASVDTEKAIMRSVDRYHQRRFGRHGIGYAEIITDSGRVYEGRGPGRWLAHARWLNDTAYGFGHMGHGNRKPRAKGAWRAGRALHRWYARKGWLKTLAYRLTGHRNHSDKDCPGTLVPDDDLAQLRPDTPDPEPDRPEEEYAMRRGDTDSDLGYPVVSEWQDLCNRFLHETTSMVETHGVEVIDDLGGEAYRRDGIAGSNLSVDGEFGAKTQRATWAVRQRAGLVLGYSLPGHHDVVTPTTQSMAASALAVYRHVDAA